MAATFEAFMAGNAIREDNIEFVASKRFVDGKGEPIPWKLHTITSGKNSELRRSSYKPKSVPGKKNKYEMGLDVDLYLTNLSVACISFPDLNNKELQDSYGVMGADELLNAMLLPGELDDLVSKVQEINGYNTDIEELAEEAKN